MSGILTKAEQKMQMSETYTVAALLAASGGFLDSYSYICRDHVFANAQTGNIVLFGIAVFDKNYVDMLKYLVPIVMFALGVLIAEWIRKHFASAVLHWRQYVILIEAIVLTITAFIPIGEYNIIANTMISFVCSLQVESFRKVHAINFATTMCTGNLRTATENVFKYQNTKDTKFLKNSLKIYGIILFFILGVILGAWITGQLQNFAVLFAVIMLLTVFVLMFIDNEKEDS